MFVLGIFYKRINAQGAYVTLVTGFLIGALRIVLELMRPTLDPDGMLYALGSMNFLTFGAWFFLFCIILAVVVSLATPAPSEAQIANLTYSTLSAEEKAKNKTSYNWIDIAISALVVAIVIGVMITFSGS